MTNALGEHPAVRKSRCIDALVIHGKFRAHRFKDSVEKDSEEVADTFIGERLMVNQRFQQKCMR